MRACAACVGNACVRCGAARSQCVCCGVNSPFFARGDWARLNPRQRSADAGTPNPEGRHAPTARALHVQHTHASLPRTFWGEVLGLHCSAQSV